MNRRILETILLDMVREDLGSCGDTLSFIPDKKITAKIISREKGILSGAYELKTLFGLFNIKTVKNLSDGGIVNPQDTVFLIKGSARDIFTVERVALNILSRMSGISTTTRKFVDVASKINPKVRIAATRKTIPLFRYFEKKAIKVAGGDTHRASLSDMVLIKTNYIKLLGEVGRAIAEARKTNTFAYKICVEVNNLNEAIDAAQEKVDIIMFDNLKPYEIVKIINQLGKKDLRKGITLEASGGITLDNLEDYVETGVDVISSGHLTHSANPLDFSLFYIKTRT